MIAAYILAACIAAVPAGGSDRPPEPAYRQSNKVREGEITEVAQSATSVRLNVYTEIEPAELAASMPEDIGHLAADVVRICREQGVNAEFIAAVMRWERRLDLHNYFGWTCNDGKLKRFEDDLDCLERVIPLIKKLYLTPGGRYYHGATVEGVSVCYNNTDLWREAITKTMEGMG